ncbi:hypothetical protein [Legionella sp.]|uniref:hypothetical protein n=1 Tax=Legionella sp. TaxID=459 RepID=UPI003D0F500C
MLLYTAPISMALLGFALSLIATMILMLAVYSINVDVRILRNKPFQEIENCLDAIKEHNVEEFEEQTPVGDQTQPICC